MAFSFDDEPASTPTPAPDSTPQTDEAGEIMQSMPEPQQHAIDAAAHTDSEAPTGETGGDVDEAGEVWNPAVHATGRDGKGVKTAKGLWRRRKGTGSGPRTTSKVYKPADNSANEAAAQAQAATAAAARVTAQSIASSIFMLGRAFGGEAWKPTPEEVTQNYDAWTQYCLVKGITDFPPGIAVCICTLGYIGPRLFIPETQQRVGTIKQWFAVRVAKFRVKRELKKRGIVANVTIAGKAGVNPYDSIVVDGKPYNEMKNAR